MALNLNEQAKNQIAKALDLSGLKDFQRDKVISGLLDNISLRVNLAIFEKLNDQEKEKVTKLLKTAGSDEVFHYLNGKMDNLPELMEKITSEAIEEFKGLAK